MTTALLFLKLVIPVIILSVWVLRPNLKTEFRGGNARTLKEEFIFYGFNVSTFYLVGIIKITLSFLLLLSIWHESLLLISSLGISVLMLTATICHLRAKDNFKKIYPSFTLFVLTLIIAFI